LLLVCAVRAQAEPAFASVEDQLSYLAGLREEDLAKYDIAYLNLVCAQGLKGAENLDIPACLAKLNEIAGFVRANTDVNLYKFRQNPADFAGSEGQFRALAMVTFAVKGYGIQYNPALIETPDNLSADDVFFADSRNVFLNGLLQRDPGMGTCSSLPVFWTALGRRLGYPLYMSNTLLHFFTRWEKDGERFNFEGSQNGCAIDDDEHYRNFPVKVDEAKIERLGLLKSFTRKEELMHFLITRGACLHANGRLDEAKRTYELAVTCFPSNFSRTALELYLKQNHE
jgi:hypothetical protein